ncbi:MAG: galactose-binding domain-containing protein [Thermoanaerobaculia bacterium]
MKRLLALFTLIATPLFAQQTLDDFESVSEWIAAPSKGVDLRIGTDAGTTGRAMRLDVDFRGGGGYAIARLPVALDLPDNYEFSFRIRGAIPVNTLEFKVVDETGDNVWWTTRPRWHFPGEWTRLRIKKRHLKFAWGPKGGGEITKTSALEIVVTAAEGGRGTVWIDDLTFTPLLPERPYDLTPNMSWRGRNYEIDFLRPREFGGLVIAWPSGRPGDYDVQLSDDAKQWTTVWRVRGASGIRDYVHIPEGEARYVRLAAAKRVGSPAIDVQPAAFGETKIEMYRRMARDAKAGLYPRYLNGEQSYWTIVGAPADEHEALINQEGTIDVDPLRFSLDPFIVSDGTILTWSGAKHTQTLEDGELPIPSVVRDHGDLSLTITAWDRGQPGHSVLWLRYRIENRGPARSGKFHLAIRPLQVNPPWQFLAVQGGAADVRSITRTGNAIVVGNATTIVPVSAMESFGAARFEQGDPVIALESGSLPTAPSVEDPFGSASGIMTWPFSLATGASSDIIVTVPFHGVPAHLTGGLSAEVAARRAEEELAVARTAWRERLGRVGIELPPAGERIARAIRSQLAYILINQDGPSIEPGARSYDRSWIRDGSLTSAALLRLDHADEVARFIEWYARHQRADGCVPCCVDARGADPVPEHDSHGQFIYLISEYYRFTRDRKFLERMWPHVVKAVDFIDQLRHERMTPEYRTPEKRAFFGLVPESISHEGYSAKPMHSYWDDTFILRGLRDAADLASILCASDSQSPDCTTRDRFVTIRDEFERDFRESIRLSMEHHGIDYIPGSVELGDFDATSTTTMVNPGGEEAGPLAAALKSTFERYWSEFVARREGLKEWDAYTPYEWRTVGTFVRFGNLRRAHEITDWFFSHSRPAGWNHWAEVIFPNPKTPRFIGDMPHTWVGSDFIRSMIDMLVIDEGALDDGQGLLRIAPGLPAAWLREGVTVRNLQTPYGPLSYTVREDNGKIFASVVRSKGFSAMFGGAIETMKYVDSIP